MSVTVHREPPRCDPPRCVRRIGHADECRPTFHRRAMCGKWLPKAGAPCARTAGHGWQHESEWGMETRRERARRAYSPGVSAAAVASQERAPDNQGVKPTEHRRRAPVTLHAALVP